MLNLPESSAIAVVSALKVEPISKTPTLIRLMRSFSSASTGLFGSKSGSETRAIISPVFTSRMAPAAALALNFAMPFCELVAQGVLDAQIDRELDRLEVRERDVEAGAVEILQALAVDVFLDAGDADIVDVGEAEHVRRGVARSDRRACSRAGSRRPGCRGDAPPPAGAA